MLGRVLTDDEISERSFLVEEWLWQTGVFGIVNENHWLVKGKQVENAVFS